MKKLCTLAIGLLVLMQICPAQGVKQLWGTDIYNSSLFSMDTSTFASTERINFYNSGHGTYPVDFKVVNGKIYGSMLQGSFLYEYDPMTLFFDRKISFDEGFLYPFGAVHHLTRKDNDLYLLSQSAIRAFELPEGYNYDFVPLGKWDIGTQSFSEIVTGQSSFNFTGPLVEHNGKFYCLSFADNGMLLEWEPGSNSLVPKVGFPPGERIFITSFFEDYKAPTSLGDKLYILTLNNLYAWDPATNMLELKHSFNNYDDEYENEGFMEAARLSLIEKNGKLYGFTAWGGSDKKGTIFEWDPQGAGSFSIKQNLADLNLIDIVRFIDGGDRIFGVVSEDASPFTKKIFEYFPSTNELIIKRDAYIPNGEAYLLPAPVSLFTTNTCTSFTPVTVDGSNNNSWVPLVDDKGDVLAEFHPHGNNLGTVNIEAYIHEGAIRKDGRGQPYLDRTITINPQNTSIADPVELRLYITRAEFEALKADPGSGINDITDLAIFKSSDACSGGLITSALPIATTYENYEFGYVLKAFVSSFSTFYFSNRTFEALPLQFIEFTAVQKGRDALVGWTTENEINTKDFVVERSIDGIQFVSLGTVAANNTAGEHGYSFTDKGIDQLNTTIVYYRLKQRDADGRFEYSKTISIRLNSSVLLKVNPNPAGNVINVSYKMKSGSNTTLQIIDAGGKKVLEQKLSSQALTHKINIQSLSRGVYMLSVTDNGERLTTRFIKQ